MGVKEDGISVIVCCYNSASRIIATLEHLVAQKVSPKILWEIILVDNNSSDNTATIAKQYIENHKVEIPFRIVTESQPGLSYARNKGFNTAAYEIVLMVDDDNSLAPDYVEGIFFAFKDNPDVGMVGGLGIAVLETEPPDWFEQYAYCYATGSQTNHPEKTEAQLLYGAGLALRLEVLKKLKKAGFKSIITDRTGSNLMSGGDTELCYAYRMAGYKLIYKEELTFEHHLPKPRTNWVYLRKLFLGFGLTKARLDIYSAAISNSPIPKDGRFPFWFNRVVYLLTVLLTKDGWLLLKSMVFNLEERGELLTTIAKWGQIKAIIGIRKNYLDLYKSVYDLKQKLENGE